MVHTPLTFRQIYDSPLGRLTLSSNGQALTGLWMEGQQHFPADTDTWPLTALPVFDMTMAWLDQYFGGADPQVPLPPLLPAGTPFQQAVWHMLTEISRGAAGSPGRRPCRRAQPHQHTDTVPPRSGRRRTTYRICRRTEPKTLAADPRRGFQETMPAIKQAPPRQRRPAYPP